ncbi:hypothetical protein [Sulfurimonas sp.]|jgi:hypothetical protein|uniref:hypothetical protein n=1 Tax=Sulfurimonas sp. TaxID=2022749 RepID=UPI0025E53630|nr:hypothetical protein [Sulfurimonas sp.]MBT5934442.1 hypothetical protein [Sulfurimonas sp.]
MKKNILIIVLALSLVLPAQVNAGFFRTVVKSATAVSLEMLKLMSKMSDDIGIMADDIGIMADRILTMADKIVHTEQLMADLILDVAELNTKIVDKDISITNTTLLLSSTNQTNTTFHVAPTLVVNAEASEYIIYVSSNITMNTNTISIIVHNLNELQNNWAELSTISQNNKIYISVKSIENNIISSVSNTVGFDIY